jgi:hypothetical protein
VADPQLPPELGAALAGAQSLTPQAQGNPTGAGGSAFTAAVKQAIDILNSALDNAPSAAAANTVTYAIQRLQDLESPWKTSALAALQGMH